MCVINGRLFAYLSGDVWDINELAELSCFGFSGPGSLAAAMRFRGTIAQRFMQLMGIYLTIAIAAITITVISPFFGSLLPSDTRWLIALHLIGMALRLSDIPILRSASRWGGLEASMQVLLALMLVRAIQYGTFGSILWHMELNRAVLGALAIALSAGFGLTTIGLLLGSLLPATVSLYPLKCGAAISLLASAMIHYLHLPIPSVVPLPPIVLQLGPLAIGLLGTVIVGSYGALNRAQRGSTYRR
jgi:hypothetical protein